MRIFDRNGVLLRTAPARYGPVFRAGENRMMIKAAGSGNVTLTSIALGE